MRHEIFNFLYLLVQIMIVLFLWCRIYTMCSSIESCKWWTAFNVENFAKMLNIQHLVLNDCDMYDNLKNILDELRYLHVKQIPLTRIPPMLDLFNLITLDFSGCNNLTIPWIVSLPALEVCYMN